MVLGLALLCGACATQRHLAAKAPAPPPDPKTQMRALEDRIFVLIQAERKKLDPHSKTLMLDPVLVDVARKRSVDMIAKKYFADTAPNGTTSASLVMDEDANFQGLLGVNIAAQHYTKEGGIDVNVFAQRFLDTWLNSPSHRDNLSFPDYNRTGIGAAVNGDTVYVTELFATDLGLPPPPPDNRAKTATLEPDMATAKSDLRATPHLRPASP